MTEWERTKAGLDRIRELRGKGWKWGPTPKMTPAKIKRAGTMLNVKRMSGPEVAAKLGVSTPSVYGHWRKNPKWTKKSPASVPRFIPRKPKKN